MALLPITLIGDKILRKKAALVKDVDAKTIELIRDMFETMRNARGIGLAANQVGADKSIFIVDVSVVEGHEDAKAIGFYKSCNYRTFGGKNCNGRRMFKHSRYSLGN